MDDISSDFLSIGIVGAIVSLVFEWIKKNTIKDSLVAKISIIIASIVVGLVYFYIRRTSWWLPMVGILGASQIVHGLFLTKNTSQ